MIRYTEIYEKPMKRFQNLYFVSLRRNDRWQTNIYAYLYNRYLHRSRTALHYSPGGPRI